MTDSTRSIQSETDTYHFVRELGEGGQGKTWLARRERDSLVVVVKELHLDKVSDWKAVEHFEREIGALSSLEHPGIPAFIDRAIDEQGHTQALIQQYVEGPTLDEQLRRGPLSPEHFERALRDLLQIAEHLHSRVPPLVHRDIQPRNIVLGEDRAYLVDFGVATWSQATNATAVGTFGYVAQEQLLGRAAPASDLYSIGMSFLATANAKDAADFPIDPNTGQVDVESLLHSVPARARQTLRALTRPGLGQRVATASDALELLRQGVRPNPVPEPTSAPMMAHPSQPPASTPNAVIFVSLAAVLILAAGGIFVFLAAGSGQAVNAPEATTAESSVMATSASSSDYASPPAVAPVVPDDPPPPQNRPSQVLPLGRHGDSQLPPPTPSTAALGAHERDPEGVVVFDGARATLSVNSVPPAQVVVGGEEVCLTPCQLRVPYGLFSIDFVREGRTIRREVRVNEDTTLAVSFSQ